MVRVRFAPSPTGHLHIGGARTALFNMLYARKTGGIFVLRIEDTDLERSTKESEDVIIRDLKWLGIEWDEGVAKGGQFGPYRSTERVDIYNPYVERLLKEGKAYYCYCSPEELEQQRQAFLEKGEMPRYSGKCRNLTIEDRKRLEDMGKKPVVRFKVPENENIVVDDLIRGHVVFDSNGIGDFIIVKSDGIPVYNFAATIDDYLMEITHVIRGEEHLSNTPRQVLIYQALGFKTPAFAHVSLILGRDRTKMSKRHGSTWVEQYRDQGYLPEAVINFLALLGWSPEGEQEIFNLDELIEQFSLDRVAKNPAVFDVDKLNWLNGHYIRSCPLQKLTELAVQHLVDAGLIKANEVKPRWNWLMKVVDSLKNNLTTVSDIVPMSRIFFDEDVCFETPEAEGALKTKTASLVIEALLDELTQVGQSISPDEVKQLFKKVQKSTGIKGKDLYMPVRVAVTGQVHGPELVNIISILGPSACNKRIKKTFGSLTHGEV
jgi:nondiscriminating glutamyl-tRNA synthetase